MRTETITRTLYKFEELGETAQAKAIESCTCHNVDYDWWDAAFEDAKDILCKISHFDIDRGNCIGFSFSVDAEETAKAIIANHGKPCETYKLAIKYLADYEPLRNILEGNDWTTDTHHKAGDLAEEFRRALGEEYLSNLRKEYEYQISEEAVKETIQANEYEFLESGEPA